MLKEEVKDTTIVFEQLFEAPVIFITPDPCSHNSRPLVDVNKTNQRNVLKKCYAMYVSIQITRFQSWKPSWTS